MGWIAERQFKRDHAGLRNTCAARGHEGAPTNPLVVADDGMRVHLPTRPTRRTATTSRNRRTETVKATTGCDFAASLEAKGVTIWKWGLNHDYFYASRGDRHVVVGFVENGPFDSAQKTDRYGYPLQNDPNRALRSRVAIERYPGI